MRRAASVILFVLGCWILATEVMTAWLDMQAGLGAQLVGLGVFVGLAAAPLLLGAWASPGNRLAELGLALMIGAGVGATISLVLVMVLNDPGFAKVMPPDQPMPNFHFAPLFGLLNLLVIGGAGFALRRWAIARTRRDKPPLEQVFD